MTIDEVAKILKISPGQVQALIDGGQLTATQPAPELLIDPVSVMEHLSRGLRDESLKLAPKQQEPLAAAMLVPLSLVTWTIFAFVMLFSTGDGEPIVAPALFGAASAAWIGATGWLAHWGGGLSTTNGMGVTLYGRRKSERGPIATAYLVLMMLPLVPLRSFIVHNEVEHEPDFRSRQTSYQLEQVPLCWPQAAPTTLGAWLLLAAGAAAWIYS